MYISILYKLSDLYMIILASVGPVCPHSHRRRRNYNNGQLDRQKREAELGV